jgi:hypothetical protein
MRKNSQGLYYGIWLGLITKLNLSISYLILRLLISKHDDFSDYWQHYNNFTTSQDIERYLSNLEITTKNLQICFENNYQDLAM